MLLSNFLWRPIDPLTAFGYGYFMASMVATKANSPLSRPLCAYPQLARYKGTGDTNDAANFTCSAP